MIPIMASDLQKYRANLFQVSGFSLMVPISKIILNLNEMSLEDLNLQFFFYVLPCFLLAYLGLALIAKGDDTMERGKKKEKREEK